MEFQELLRSLCFVGSRKFLLLIEEEFKHLLQVQQSETKSETWHKIRFPPMTSNHRWMIHATAARFGLDSTSVGWGYDRTTTVTCNKNSRVPILSYIDFIPFCNSEWEPHLLPITKEPQKPVIIPVPTQQSSSNNNNNKKSDSINSNQADKKRRRPNFAQPYSVARRMNNPSSTTVVQTDNKTPTIKEPPKKAEIDTSSTQITAEHELDSKGSKKVRGRGAVGKMRSTEPLEDSDNISVTQAEEDLQNASSNTTTEKPKTDEEDMQPEPTVTLVQDYTMYTADTIRAKEDKHNKTYADLSANHKTQSKPSKWKEERTQISWSEAWQLRKQGKGVIEFGCNKLDSTLDGSICLYLSPTTRSVPKNAIYVSLHAKVDESLAVLDNNTSVHFEIGSGSPGQSVLHTGTCPIIQENQLISFWVALTGETLMFGCGLFPQHRIISITSDLVAGLLYFGFSAWNHPIRLKNISIKGAPCDILATLSHLVVVTIESSVDDVSTSLLNLCQKLIPSASNLKCYPIRNASFFLICQSSTQAKELLQAFSNQLPEEFDVRIVDAQHATGYTSKDAELQALVRKEIEFDTTTRPTSDATVANRMISRYMTQ